MITNFIEKIKNLATGKKRIVFVPGRFDILHPGHLRLLHFAKECGDFLVVGVQSDKEIGGAAYMKESLRLETISEIACVDYAFIMDSPAIEFIRKLKPQIVVKGKEHENAENPEAKIIKSYGGKLLFGSGETHSSVLETLHHQASMRVTNFQKVPDYLARHSFNKKNLLATIKKFTKLKIIVIGDTIIDEYITCDPLGMSREEPTLVVTPLSRESYIGGAAIVAAHAAAMGVKTLFYSVVGQDDGAQRLHHELTKNKVTQKLFYDNTRPTTIKQRFRADNKSLLRVNILRQHEISTELQQKIKKSLFKELANTDLVVFSDFSYGCLPQALIDEIAQICRAKKIPYIADSQSSSQTGDIGRFTYATLITPTEHEMRLSLRDNNSGMVAAAEKLRQKTHTENILVTLNKEGVFIHHGAGKTYQNDRLPALNENPQDVAGAGDSLLIFSGLALTAGADIWQSAYIGSIAAACQVSQVGNIPLNPNLIISELAK